jgi:hypothetical protein
MSVYSYTDFTLSMSYYKLVITEQSIMDQHTYENWVRIKETIEASGNTKNMFYTRACEIVKSRKDPLEKFLNGK